MLIAFSLTVPPLTDCHSRRRSGISDNATFSRVFFTAPTAPVSFSIAILILLAFGLSVAPAIKVEDSSTHVDNPSQPILEAGATLFLINFALLVMFYIFHAVRFRLNPSLGDSRGRTVRFISSINNFAKFDLRPYPAPPLIRYPVTIPHCTRLVPRLVDNLTQQILCNHRQLAAIFWHVGYDGVHDCPFV
jgi:hypothetical protein